MNKDQNQESTKQVVVTVKIVITTLRNGLPDVLAVRAW